MGNWITSVTFKAKLPSKTGRVWETARMSESYAIAVLDVDRLFCGHVLSRFLAVRKPERHRDGDRGDLDSLHDRGHKGQENHCYTLAYEVQSAEWRDFQGFHGER
jgi:hypothetical protein